MRCVLARDATMGDVLARRTLLLSIAAAALGMTTACATEPDPRAATPIAHRPAASAAPLPTPTTTPTPTPTPTPPPLPPITKAPIPSGVITALPGQGNLLGWTVDDGADTATVQAYAQFARDSGTRITFFLNGKYDSWRQALPVLGPLVESGQVQLGNHTFDHLALTKISNDQIHDQLGRNEEFIRSTYGVDPRPFYRPPYGYTDARTRAAAAGIGYDATVMWYGSLADSALEDPQQIVALAQQWFLPQHIVIGHANFTPVTQVYAQLVDIIRQRDLQTVTLRDVFRT